MPDSGDTLARGRAGLVVLVCLGLVVVYWCMAITWLVSGDLQWQTPLGGLVFSLVMAGIVALARSGRITLSAWILVILMALFIAIDAAVYGLGSPAAAGLVIPIVLAACTLGLWAGLGVALASSTTVGLIAWSATAGWYQPLTSVEIWHLTLNVPVYVAIFLLVALLVGMWTRWLSGALRSDGDAGGDCRRR